MMKNDSIYHFIKGLSGKVFYPYFSQVFLREFCKTVFLSKFFPKVLNKIPGLAKPSLNY